MMKQVMKSLVVVGAMLAAGSAAAMMDDVKPSVGVDYYQAWMRGQNTYTQGTGNFKGQDMFAKSFPGASVYVGAKFMEYVGAELGYSWSSNKSRTVSAGSTPVTLRNKVRRSGTHLDLVGYLPVNDCANLFASVGMGWVKAKISDFTSTIGTASTNPSVSSKTKSVARLGVGANYMFTEMVGVRAKVGYEGTSSLRNNIANATNTSNGDKKYFKDSTTAAAGLFAQF